MAREGTVAIFQGAIGTLATAPWMTQASWRVLIYLIGDMEPANYLYYSAAECARRLQMSYGICYRAWRVLQAGDLLRLELNDRGQTWRYRLSPYLCWRGRPWKARIAQRNWDAEADLRRLASQWQGTGPQ